MTNYYLTFNDSGNFEAFGNLKLSNKKLKQQEWFKLEPQSMSFELLYYPNVLTVQEELSNYIIDSLFAVPTIINGIVADAVIRLYNDNILLFTGIVDLSQSEHNTITKDSKVFCYDYLKFLSMLKDDGFEIIDNYISLLSLANIIKDKINEYGIVSNFSFATYFYSPEMDISKTINTGQINSMGSNELLRIYGFYEGYGNYNNMKMAIYCNIERLWIDGETKGMKYEYFLIGIYGLCYKKYFHINDRIYCSANDIGTVDMGNPDDEASKLFSTIQAKYQEYQIAIFTSTELPIETNIDGLNYVFSSSSTGDTDSEILMTGSPFFGNHCIGEYVDNGYNPENKNNVIDILKMFLKANGLICFVVDSGLQILNYLNYGENIGLIDDDIAFSNRQYSERKQIDEIEVSPENNEIWLEVLNEYYSSVISSYVYSVKIIKAGNETIKVGDRITNTTYNLDLFIIKLDYNLGKNYISVEGV